MIFETPQQSEEVLRGLHSNNYLDRPIKERFTGFESCFLAFHPFLLIKDGHEAQIHFQTGKWPSKTQIVEHCEKLSWSNFFRISEISDYKKLDQALGFFHRAYRLGNRNEYQKLKALVADDSSKILIAQDFDQRFTYFLGPSQLIEEAINYISLEGFYCDNQTCESWSFEVFPEDNRIDWLQDMKS